jgi:imidazoleglycerol-phosphate dehydratase/histidinol-phosphatase
MKVLFIDRDGTLIHEPETDQQVDSLEKLSFIPGVFTWLGKIARETDYRLVMVTNQDGLGTESFPEADFWPAQNKMMEALKGEGICFDEILIDKSFPEENLPTRKPGTGLLTHYLPEVDRSSSYVIGDRKSDMTLAKNIGCRGLWLNGEGGEDGIELVSSWEEIYGLLCQTERRSKVSRVTRETEIEVELNLDGSGCGEVSTGLNFFDHMLDQIIRHGQIDMKLKCRGDLNVDEHHTMEDVGLALGQAFREALGDKAFIDRYGFVLPMDDCKAEVAIDFGGRPWLVWEADFKREKIGDCPTEMFSHFFKSFSDEARCNLNIKAEGKNEHHKIEAIFKAWARAIKAAVRRDSTNPFLASTKGSL